MIFVVDASVAVKWLVAEPLQNQALDLMAPGITRVAPDLIFSEVGNALWLKMKRGEVSSDQARFIIVSLEGFFDEIVRSEEIASRALEISQALDHPVYDCFYLACTEKVQDSQLVTADMRLIKKVRDSGMNHLIIPLSEFSSSVKPKLRISDEKISEVFRRSEFFQKLSAGIREKLRQENALVISPHVDLMLMVETPAFRNLIAYIQELSGAERADLLALCWLADPAPGQRWLSVLGRAEQSVAANSDESAMRYLASKLLNLGKGLELYRNL